MLQVGNNGTELTEIREWKESSEFGAQKGKARDEFQRRAGREVRQEMEVKGGLVNKKRGRKGGKKKKAGGKCDPRYWYRICGGCIM